MKASTFRLLLGSLCVALVAWVWSLLFYVILPIPYYTMSQTADDQAAGAALLEHFPESGIYFIPGNSNPPELRAELYERGPTGFVIIDVDGRPEFDPSIMLMGFALNGFVMVLWAVLFRLCVPSAWRYVDRLNLIFLVAAIAVVMVNLGDVAWWALPLNWELAQAFYNFTALVLGGAIVARFVHKE